jgi:hypothetical protein
VAPASATSFFWQTLACPSQRSTTYLHPRAKRKPRNLLLRRPRLPEKKKKDKKKKRDLEAAKIDNEPMTKKRPAPETVVDPSIQIPSTKRAKVASTTSKKPSKPRKQDSSKDDEDRFKDSRGNGPRMLLSLFYVIQLIFTCRGRKTEEGFSIFKEDELGIGGEGGGETDLLILFICSKIISFSDTPLCPFDCQCCMSNILCTN